MQDRNEPSKPALIRDLFVFNVKLWLDGVKDIVLAPVSIGAGLIDIMRGSPRGGPRLHDVIRLGERFDEWLDLYGAARNSADPSPGAHTVPDDAVDRHHARVPEPSRAAARDNQDRVRSAKPTSSAALPPQ